MVAILGAGGAIGTELVKQLRVLRDPVRLVSRSSKQQVAGVAESVTADLTIADQAVRAIAGCSIAYLVAGLKYDSKVWREQWPRIMLNTIEAAKKCNTRLLFFDNVYMYGKVDGVMTEETPYQPRSKKGEIRAEIATTLLNEIQAGNLTAMIARSADFYGPNVSTGIPNILVFDKYAAGAKAQWFVNDNARHSFTYTLDAAKSLVLLSGAEHAWNQTWHVPTAPDPPTGKEFIALVAREFRVEPKYRVLHRPMLWMAGLFDTTIRELNEMLYQYESDYIFDSTKFTKAFQVEALSYAEGIHKTAQTYGR